MELDLVKVTNKATGAARYYAVNDKHYDAMLAGGGSSLDDAYSWERIGTVDITEEILNEQGFFYKE